MDEKIKLIKNCEICGNDATCICFNCKFYYCDSCFKSIHDKINSNHKKEKIDLYVPIELKCRNHPDIPLNLFCADEKGN